MAAFKIDAQSAEGWLMGVKHGPSPESEEGGAVTEAGTPQSGDSIRSNRKWLFVGGVAAIYIAGGIWQAIERDVAPIFDRVPEAVATTLPSTPQVSAPDRNAEEGAACDTPGRLGFDGSTPMLCSGSTIDGDPLPNPLWRPTAGETPVLGLSALEQDVVDFVKQESVLLRTSGDAAILLVIHEYARAAELASASNIAPGTALLNLARGFQEANAVSAPEAMEATAAVLFGVMQLYPYEPAGDYSYEMMKWLIEETGG